MAQVAKKAINPRSARGFDKDTGSRVRTFRNAAGLSQEELGDKLGVSFQQIQKYEKGTNRISLYGASVLADTLGCSLPELAGQDDSQVPKLSKALANIDFKLMEEFSQFEDGIKPAVLAMLRLINKGYNGRGRK